MSRALFLRRRVLWMPLEAEWSAPARDISHCCGAMYDALQFECTDHTDPFACADALIVYNDILCEYGLIIHDGSASYVLIEKCPWCGTQLPASARDAWFDQVEALNLADDEPPPARFLSAAWRRH
jgi:hypothetical protein